MQNSTVKMAVVSGSPLVEMTGTLANLLGAAQNSGGASTDDYFDYMNQKASALKTTFDHIALNGFTDDVDAEGIPIKLAVSGEGRAIIHVSYVQTSTDPEGQPIYTATGTISLLAGTDMHQSVITAITLTGSVLTVAGIILQRLGLTTLSSCWEAVAAYSRSMEIPEQGIELMPMLEEEVQQGAEAAAEAGVEEGVEISVAAEASDPLALPIAAVTVGLLIVADLLRKQLYHALDVYNISAESLSVGAVWEDGASYSVKPASPQLAPVLSPTITQPLVSYTNFIVQNNDAYHGFAYIVHIEPTTELPNGIVACVHITYSGNNTIYLSATETSTDWQSIWNNMNRVEATSQSVTIGDTTVTLTLNSLSSSNDKYKSTLTVVNKKLFPSVLGPFLSMTQVPKSDNPALPDHKQLGNTTYTAGVAVAVSRAGLPSFITGWINALTSVTGPTIADIPGLITQQPCDGGYFLNSVDVSDGSLSYDGLTIQSLTPTGTVGEYLVTMSMSGTATYANWSENGTFSPPPSPQGMPRSWPFSNNYSNFSFHIDSLIFSGTATLAYSEGSDPLNPEPQLQVSFSNVTQEAMSVSNVHIPSGSALHVGDFFGAIGGPGAAPIAQALKTGALDVPVVNALNILLLTIPDSGKVSSDAYLLFAPVAQPIFPSGGGLQMALIGKIVDPQNPAPFTPSQISIPDLPSEGMAIRITPYVFSAAAWDFSAHGGLDGNYPRPEDPVATFDTSTFQSSIPALYSFAPNCPIKVSVTPKVTPTFSAQEIYYLDGSSLSAVSVPAGIINKLSSMFGTVYANCSIFSDVVAAVILPSEYSAWMPTILAASTHSGLACTTVFNLSVVVVSGGADKPACTFTLTTLHVIPSLSIGDSLQNNTQSMSYTLTYESYTLDLGSSAFPMTLGDADVLYAMLFSAISGDITDKLQKAGAIGVPIPHLKGFLMANTTTVIDSEGILVTGNNIAVS